MYPCLGNIASLACWICVSVCSKYVKSGLYRKQRDGHLRVRTMMGAGVFNDFGMRSQPTGMDLLTVWEREQELQMQTGKISGDRTDEMIERAKMAPLWYDNNPFSGFLDGIVQKMSSFHAVLPECKTWSLKKIESFSDTGNPGDYALSPALLQELEALKTPEFLPSQTSLPYGIPSEDFVELVAFLTSRPDLSCPPESPHTQSNFMLQLEKWIAADRENASLTHQDQSSHH